MREERGRMAAVVQTRSQPEKSSSPRKRSLYEAVIVLWLIGMLFFPDVPGIDRLTREAVTGKGGVTTSYSYNNLNELESATSGGSGISYMYDDAGNRITRTEGNAIDTYGYDYENRLATLSKQSGGGPGSYGWLYDCRTRRVELSQGATVTKVSFSGGTSVREFENAVATVDYVRGSDWGGGVGGILYSLRGGVPSFTHYNRRGDVTAKTDATGAITYQSQYEAYGKRTAETGATLDRQKSNTKDEDIPGYANEGFRFRDLETGSFLTRDPAGFVDGPNLYAYVRQNPWTSFDPEGLKTKKEREEARDKLVQQRSTLQQRLERSTALGDKSQQALGDRINGLSSAIDAETKAINSIEKTAKYMRAQADKLEATVGIDKTRAYKDADNLDDETDLYRGWAATATMSDYQVGVGSIVLLDGAGKLVGGALGKAFSAIKNAIGGAAKTAGSELSVLRYTQKGETFLRYESANPAFSRITSGGGVTPGTFAASASDGLVPVAQRSSVYNLPTPEILRPNVFTLRPPPGTPVIGPRSVVGGTGNEVIFPNGF